MSEDIKITSEIKQKNPKRVEQGKRLAAMSKQAKEKKARERLLAEQEQDDNSNGSSKYIIGLILVVGTCAGAYYVYEKYKSKYIFKNKKQQSEQPKVQSEQPKKSEQGDKLVNLFD